MSFEQPDPDLAKIVAAWDEFEKGEEMPGRVLANMKTAGIHQLFAELTAAGWTPGSLAAS